MINPLGIRKTPKATTPLLLLCSAVLHAQSTTDNVLINQSGNTAQDPTFIWDSIDGRLGLGKMSAPLDKLDIFGGNIRLDSGTNASEAYNLSDRIGVGFPVPYFTPTTNNSVIAFDVYPKGKPSNFTTNTGVAWFDLCSSDINLVGGSYECLRMGKFANGDAHVSAARGGTGIVRNLDLQINGGNVGVGTRSPVALLSVGSSSQFQVNTVGNIVKLNSVKTNFPAANAPGYLTNDGAGNFSYTTVSPTYTAATLPANPSLGMTATISGGASISNCTSGSGTIVRACQWNGSAWVFSPTGGCVLSSQPGVIPAGATSFAAPGISGVASTEGLSQYVVAKSCRVSGMFMNIGVGQPTSGDMTVTLRVAPGGISPLDTTVTAMVPAGAPAGTIVSDKLDTVDLAAGDLVSIKVINTAAAPANLLTVNFNCEY